MRELHIRALEASDCEKIHQAFVAQGWKKPAAKYFKYLEMQQQGTRDFLLATYQHEFAGYLTINWTSTYLSFREKGIPEIVDFNVLKKFQRRGIGTALMDEAERRIQQVSPIAGIGFGITQDYGPAQILYIRRGYIPDGRGLLLDGETLDYGQQVIISDDLVIFLTKQLT
ncbi:MAG: GNAT family N-acetyltransferase [Saprospiraceae bacterium]|nr:GNAT family N-acetyltransferase [Saprospiraceae bacterium]